MKKCVAIFLGSIYLALPLFGQDPSPSTLADNKVGLPVLDKQQQLDRFSFWDNHDWDWFKQRIPFFESPDMEIDTTYYYRWQLMTEHLVYGSPDSGYSFSEFINWPPWGGAFGSISCPMGHQFYEIRWLKDPRIVSDYSRYWFHVAGAQPRAYSNWFGDAMWANYLVNGDKSFILQRFPDMEAQYLGWLRERFDPTRGLFRFTGLADGMEFNVASRQTDDPFDGAECYRPTLNSYIYGDLVALANTAELAGDPAKAATYRDKAAELRTQVENQLWDPNRKFFLSMFAHDEKKDGVTIIKAGTLIYEDGKYKGDSHGRELAGYIPWEFNLPEPGKGYEEAWKGVVDPDVFFAPYGLYTLEHHDPQFVVMKHPYCYWSGNNWPYADAQTLTAMANVLNNYTQSVIDKKDYFKVFEDYALSQRKAGRPYVAENQDPDTGEWDNDAFNHSEDYFHSGFIDQLITGLIGLRPRADDIVEVNPLVPETWNYFALDDVGYHGHHLSILWDRDGSRYGRGAGLTVLADGQRIGNTLKLGLLRCQLPPSEEAAPVESGESINFASNGLGGFYPRVTATFTAPGTAASNLIDGRYFYYEDRPVNRWTTVGSPNPTDSIEIDFGTLRPIQSVRLYFLDDGEGKPVRAPLSFTLEYWDGDTWQEVTDQKRSPETPQGHRPNIIDFPVVQASKLRVVLTPRSGAALGLTEVEAWGDSPLPVTAPPLPDGDLALTAHPSASYCAPNDHVEAINDGNVGMTGKKQLRWSTRQSTSDHDWVELDFDDPVDVGRMEFCFWTNNDDCRAPKSYAVDYWNGTAWSPVNEIKRNPQDPTDLSVNEVTIQPIQTTKLRATFERGTARYNALSEWLVWKQ